MSVQTEHQAGLPSSSLAAFLGAGVPDGFDAVVQRHLDETSMPGDQELLDAHRDAWIRCLLRSLDDVDIVIADLQHRLRGDERSMAVHDFEREAERIDAVLSTLVGTPTKPQEEHEELGTAKLQLSWLPDRVIAWGGGYNAPSLPIDELEELLTDAGVSPDLWESHQAAKLPDGSRADAVSAPIRSVLGWLVNRYYG